MSWFQTASGLLPPIHSPYHSQNRLTKMQGSAMPIIPLLHNLPWLLRAPREGPGPLPSLQFPHGLPPPTPCCSVPIGRVFPLALPAHTPWPLGTTPCPRQTSVLALICLTQSGMLWPLWQMLTDLSGPSLNVLFWEACPDSTR